jgi:MFS family permease
MTALASDPASYYLIRFLAGCAEAGFYPGVIYYLTTWFPRKRRATIFAWFIVAVPLSSAVSGPLSTGLLTMDGIAGLTGWQWMFAIEGMPAVLIGIVCLMTLPDRPEEARWLSDGEKTAPRRALDEEATAVTGTGSAISVFADPRALLLAASYFCFLVGILGGGIWMPQILKDAGLSIIEIGLVSILPYAAACAAMLVAARQADPSHGYLPLYVGGCVIGAIGFALSVSIDVLAMSLLGITIALAGMNGARPALFSIPAQYLTGAAAASAIAFINAAGNLGGFVGPYMMGLLKTQTGSHVAGLMGLAAMLLLAAATRLCADGRS